MYEELDESQQEKQKKLGIENGRRALKKQQKKNQRNQTLKAFWQSLPIKVRLIFTVILISIIIFVVLCASAWYILEEESIKTSTDEEYNSAVSSQKGGLDITSDRLQVTSTQIQDFINNYESDNTALKQEMINKSDKILEWQTNYGYSALFLITVAFEDRKNAEDFETFLSKMSQKATTWNTNGYKTIKEIAEDYVRDDTAGEWANNIENKMQQNALNTGIITYGELAISGDGYDSIYISKDGKMYRNYKQIKGSYCTEQWCGSSIIKDDGCSLIATTIIVSGYRNEEVDPLELAIDKGYAKKGSGMLFGDAFSGEGISYKLTIAENDYFTDSEINNIKAHVGQGKPAIIRVEYPSDFTGGNHYMTLLDYNSETNEVYLSNPSNCNEKTGWLDADWVLEYCTHFYAIY